MIMKHDREKFGLRSHFPLSIRHLRTCVHMPVDDLEGDFFLKSKVPLCSAGPATLGLLLLRLLCSALPALDWL
jgi:hypothetical protein